MQFYVKWGSACILGALLVKCAHDALLCSLLEFSLSACRFIWTNVVHNYVLLENYLFYVLGWVKIMQKHLHSYHRETGLASKCRVSNSHLTFCAGDSYQHARFGSIWLFFMFTKDKPTLNVEMWNYQCQNALMSIWVSCIYRSAQLISMVVPPVINVLDSFKEKTQLLPINYQCHRAAFFSAHGKFYYLYPCWMMFDMPEQLRKIALQSLLSPVLLLLTWMDWWSTWSFQTLPIVIIPRSFLHSLKPFLGTKRHPGKCDF